MMAEMNEIARKVAICGEGPGYLHLCVPRGTFLGDVERAVALKVPSTQAGWRFRKETPRPCSHGDDNRYHCIVDALP